MLIDHVHFYVPSAARSRNWFIDKMGFQPLTRGKNHHTQTEIVTHHSSIFFVISSPRNGSSPVHHYLNSHPPGVVDVAFQVDDLDAILHRYSSCQTALTGDPQIHSLEGGKLKFATIKGWDSLVHTLIENQTHIPFCLLVPQLLAGTNLGLPKAETKLLVDTGSQKICAEGDRLAGIDHVVLNVPRGELVKAAEFYRAIFGFKLEQSFTIKTNFSGLHSQALIDPDSKFYFNINEPTNANSQIQQFINFNQGSGIQHLALKSTNLIDTVTRMRRRGLSFLPVSKSYYSNLKQEGTNGAIPSLTTPEWRGIETQEILVDCDRNLPESLLMQIFTEPIFNQPTFFFELIERRKQARGFGKGNFQALFELMEREL